MAKNVINRVKKNEKKNSLSVLIIPMIAMGGNLFREEQFDGDTIIGKEVEPAL